MISMKTILVPFDFSVEAEFAVKWAVKTLSDEPNGRIILMNVPEIVPVIEPPYYAVEEAEAVRARAFRLLEEWKRKLPKSVACTPLVGSGDLAGDVVAACAEESVDLVVITTHGRRGLARFVHPSATERIVRDAPCPVMVLHMNAATQRMMDGDRVVVSVA